MGGVYFSIRKSDAERLTAPPTDHSYQKAVQESRQPQSRETDFAEITKIRDRLREANDRVNQLTESVETWKERVSDWEKNPSGKVDGKGIPNSDSLDEAQRKLETLKFLLAQSIQDREFLRREVEGKFMILRKQLEIAKGSALLANRTANGFRDLHQRDAVTAPGVATKTTGNGIGRTGSNETAAIVQAIHSSHPRVSRIRPTTTHGSSFR